MAGRRASWLIEVVTFANRHSSDIEHKHTNIKGSKQGKRKTYYTHRFHYLKFRVGLFT